MKWFVCSYSNDTVRNDTEGNHSVLTLPEYINFFAFLETNQCLSGLEIEINKSNSLKVF